MLSEKTKFIAFQNKMYTNTQWRSTTIDKKYTQLGKKKSFPTLFVAW